MPRYRILALTIFLIAVVLAGEWYYLSSRPEAPIKAIPLEQNELLATAPGRVFQLTDHLGQPFDSRENGGKLMLLAFGYTFCPDVCPTSLQNIASALERLGDSAEKIRPLLITVDPERDNTAVLANYVAAFHPRLIGLTGSDAEIKSMTRDFRVFVDRAPGDDDYLIDHSIFIYLVDNQGRTLKYFPGTLSVDDIVKQLTPYLTSMGQTSTQRS
jgi:protein SCO1/2